MTRNIQKTQRIKKFCFKLQDDADDKAEKIVSDFGLWLLEEGIKYTKTGEAVSAAGRLKIAIAEAIREARNGRAKK